MATQTLSTKAGELVIYHQWKYSIEIGTIVASQTVKVGSLLKGALATMSPAAAADHASITGIALEAHTTGEGETQAIPVLTRHAIVADDLTVYSNGALDADGKTTLAALGIYPQDRVSAESLDIYD